MRRLVTITLLLMLSSAGNAQSAGDREAVLKTVQAFFDTMAAKDVEGTRKIMTTDGRFYAMDLRMPDMTGAETLHLLRTNAELHEVPVIALTAHAFVDERNSALLEGFDEVIAKPCLPQDLATAIERLLEHGRVART